ncbi:hypothetical protein FQN60_010352 [Etheostoma spectabile]|uniref:Uncharacterized protein n=1 Tax=Etheostoma spectabile TaxID=54343 RepID=A0A5J5D4N6_9PERO|nr:hypothetical protein FQN60_010352 [Etheostoma spectabile]
MVLEHWDLGTIPRPQQTLKTPCDSDVILALTNNKHDKTETFQKTCGCGLRMGMRKGLREAVTAWGLDETRQVLITTDNATNMVKPAALNKWTRLQCFGHRLHLAVSA